MLVTDRYFTDMIYIKSQILVYIKPEYFFTHFKENGHSKMTTMFLTDGHLKLLTQEIQVVTYLLGSAILSAELSLVLLTKASHQTSFS